MKSEFYRQTFDKILKYQIPWKIRQVEAELFHPDGQTDIMKLTVAVRSVPNTPTHPPVMFPAADLTDNTQCYHEIHSVLLPICRAATDVKGIKIRGLNIFFCYINTLELLNLSVTRSWKLHRLQNGKNWRRQEIYIWGEKASTPAGVWYSNGKLDLCLTVQHQCR